LILDLIQMPKRKEITGDQFRQQIFNRTGVHFREQDT
jgi:hypothetical protein